MVQPSTQPLVSYPTSAGSESVQTVLQLYDNGIYQIADFQRDSDQWSAEKKSLLIESVLNNLTIPAFFLAPTSGGKFELIDGQQRLTTLKEYRTNRWPLVAHDEAEYLGDRSVHYAGKTFDQLRASSPTYAQAFESYLLTLIKLPQDVDDSTRREVFRRINEAGTPLSAQDIRLAYFGRCSPVSFIRLAGIYDGSREGSKRMIAGAKSSYGLDWPWAKETQVRRDAWAEWWRDRQTAVGQTASEMFLWYLIGLYSRDLDGLLSNQNHLAQALRVTFDGRTEEAADIFCAQLIHEAQPKTPTVLPDTAVMASKLFPTFAGWWYELHVRMPGIGVDRYRRIALLLAALSANDPASLNQDQWDLIESLLRRPRQTVATLGLDLPEARGKWIGPRGQKAQIDAYQVIAAKIVSTP